MDTNTNKKLSLEQRLIQQLVADLEGPLAKEFAVVPYDGLIVATHKDAFASLTPSDSVLYDLTSYRGGTGLGQLQYLTPGSVIPQHPSTLSRTVDDDGEADIDVCPAMKFMTHCVVLAGAQHLDQTHLILEDVHEHDQMIANACAGLRSKMKGVVLKNDTYLQASVGLDVIDADSEQSADQEFVSSLFRTCFPSLGTEHADDYVLYLVVSPKAAADYLVANAGLLNDGKKGPPNEKQLFIGPQELTVDHDNQRLCKAPVHVRLLMTTDNELMSEHALQNFFGHGSSVQDQVLTTFNESLKTGLHATRKDCQPFPPSKFLVSMWASLLLFNYPLPIETKTKRPKEPGYNTGPDLLERISTLIALYSKCKMSKKCTTSVADGMASTVVALLESMSISPEGIHLYRKDEKWSQDKKAKAGNKWPLPTVNILKENMKKAVTALGTQDTDGGLEVEAVRFAEAMGMSRMQLYMLCCYTENIFNADSFLNAEELYQKQKTKTPNKQMDPPSQDMKGKRMKALCSQLLCEGTLNVVESLLARFHNNPCLIKRYFLLNALYTFKCTQPKGNDGGAPLQHPILLATESQQKLAVKRQASSSSTKDVRVKEDKDMLCPTCACQFYTSPGKHCLCYVWYKMVAVLRKFGVHSMGFRRLGNEELQAVSMHSLYNGAYTSYKNLHSLMVNEVQSSAEHFGKIMLKHTGNRHGFGKKGKANTFSSTGQIGTVGEDKMDLDQGDNTTTPAATIKDQQQQQQQGGITDMGTDMAEMEETMRKISWLFRSVMSRLPSTYLLGRGVPPTQEQVAKSFLWNVVNMGSFLTEGNQHWKILGVKEDVNATIMGALLQATTPGATIVPLEKNTPCPEMTGHSSSAPSSSFFTPVTTQETCSSYVQWAGNQSEDQQDECEAMPPAKKFKKTVMDDSTRERKQGISDLIKATTYAICMKTCEDPTAKYEIPEDDADIRSKYLDVLTQLRNADNKERTRKELMSMIGKVFFGRFDSHKGTFFGTAFHNTSTTNLLYKATEDILGRVPTFMKQVVALTAETLGMTIEEVDQQFREIVHHKKTVVREMVSWVDPAGTDSMTRKSQFMSVYGVFKHICEARSLNMAPETKTVNRSNAESLMQNDKGPYSRMSVATVHTPFACVTAVDKGQDDGDGGPTVKKLFIDQTKPSDTKRDVSFFLPMKMKVVYNTTEITDGNKIPVKNEQEEGWDRWVPPPLMDRSEAHAPPRSMKSVPELYETLTSNKLRFADIGSNMLSDVTAHQQTLSYVMDYISKRTLPPNDHRHNAVMEPFLQIIADVACKLGIIADNVYNVIASSVGLPRQEGKFDNMVKNTIYSSSGQPLETFTIGNVCKEDSALTSALYLFILCCELYAPQAGVRGWDAARDRDIHAVQAVMAGFLRLFLGASECDAVVRKEDVGTSKLIPTLWNYVVNSEKKPVQSVADARKSGIYMVTTNINVNSFTPQMGTNVITALRGGGPFSNRSNAQMHYFTYAQKIGEHNAVLCKPLVRVSNNIRQKTKETVIAMIEQKNITEYLQYIKDHPDFMEQCALPYYLSFAPEGVDTCTDLTCPETLGDMVHRAHSQATEEERTAIDLFLVPLLCKEFTSLAAETIGLGPSLDLDEECWSDDDYE